MYVDKNIWTCLASVFRCQFRFWYPMDCPSKSISKTLYPPWLYINDCFVQQKSAIFLGKWTNFLKFLTSCLAKGDYAPSFPTEKFGQNGENYSPLHYLNHNRQRMPQFFNQTYQRYTYSLIGQKIKPYIRSFTLEKSSCLPSMPLLLFSFSKNKNDT